MSNLYKHQDTYFLISTRHNVTLVPEKKYFSQHNLKQYMGIRIIDAGGILQLNSVRLTRGFPNIYIWCYISRIFWTLFVNDVTLISMLSRVIIRILWLLEVNHLWIWEWQLAIYLSRHIHLHKFDFYFLSLKTIPEMFQEHNLILGVYCLSQCIMF